MVFFAPSSTETHPDLNAALPDSAASLTPDQVHALGVPLYERKSVKIDYVRPGIDELSAHFASLGLAGALLAGS